jgi:hypothetical protein
MRYPGMKRRDRRLLFLISLLLFSLVFTFPGLSNASQGGDDVWSFRFNNVTVAEALKELSKATGVTLFANRPPQDRRVNKSYERQTIEQILRDVFKGQSYTLVWHYGEKGLESIGIWFLMNKDASGPSPERAPSPSTGWSVQRSQSYEMPQIDLDKLPDKFPPPAGNRLVGSRPPETGSVDEGGEDEEAAASDEDQEEPAVTSTEPDENEPAENEPAEDEPAEDEPAPDETEAEDQPSEDEASPSQDTEDEPQESSS